MCKDDSERKEHVTRENSITKSFVNCTLKKTLLG